MKIKYATPLLALLFQLMCVLPAFAQAQKPPLRPSEEAMERRRIKGEYTAFRKKIVALPQFAEERKRIPALQRQNKGAQIKVIPTIDSTADTDDKNLTGYITQVIGDNAVNVYEITYNRADGTITQVKATGDGEKPEAKPAPAKPSKAQATKPKKKTDDDADDEDTEEDEPSAKPGKKKDKEEE
ncbi:MAG: hypothetical protein EBX41_04490 [Chitinophagia bacterium]|nr:hypothetical protein [Chitinophagia bacterium]